MRRRERRTLKSMVGREGRLKANLAWQIGGLRSLPQNKGWALIVHVGAYKKFTTCIRN